MEPEYQRLLRSIPAVDTLLCTPEGESLVAQYSRATSRDALNAVLDDLRERVLAGKVDEGDVRASHILEATKGKLRAWYASRPTRVINATGVILHTNLGRAPMCEAAVDAMIEVAGHYCDLEYELPTGRRGGRGKALVDSLARLTGVEDALVVNNNAAAVLLVLSTFARDHEVVVSRGELVEIGGSFRIPDVMAASGARLREVGTTNRTHAADYLQAIGEETAALMKVHPSNFHIAGFTASVAAATLADLAREAGVLSIFDLGSGFLGFEQADVVAGEPSVEGAITAGVDIITFSGDKLLGGPQAGIILGSSDHVRKLRAHSLYRALRIDKVTTAALHATLQVYGLGRAAEDLPVWRMLSLDIDALKSRAEVLVGRLNAVAPGQADSIAGHSRVGGGSAPGTVLKTVLVRFVPDTRTAEDWSAALRALEVPVIVRVSEDAVMIDPRTLLPGEDDLVVDAFRALADAEGGEP